MNKIVRILGSAVFTVAMYCVPILLTCSFCYGWHGFVKLTLWVCAMLQFVYIFSSVIAKAEEGEG